MKKGLFAAVLASFVGFFGMAHGADGSVKIGVIDLQKIHQDAKVAKDLQAQVEKHRSALQNEHAKLEEELHGAEKKLIEDQKRLSEADFNQKRVAFENQVAEAQKKAGLHRESLENAFSDAVVSIRKNLETIANEIAAQEGYTLMLPLAAVLYHDKSYDITDRVLKVLDEKMPSVTLKIAS